ncbi:MAG TPA: DUF3305 domain-containing protein [Rhabdaerophilum sp.]|nr:DUF3305 domain-containing protein [Rhabdaerophilum sp.]
MPEEVMSVGVFVDKRKAVSPWIDHTWAAAAVVIGMPQAPRMTLIEKHPDFERYYAGSAALLLASGETGNYRDNLMSGAPKLWVILREDPEDGELSLLTVTADPSEGESYAETECNIVETVPMIPEIAGLVADFVDRFHVEREFYKRKRDKVDFSQGGRRPPRD